LRRNRSKGKILVWASSETVGPSTPVLPYDFSVQAAISSGGLELCFPVCEAIAVIEA
jgi:hypothetical protein